MLEQPRVLTSLPSPSARLRRVLQRATCHLECHCQQRRSEEQGQQQLERSISRHSCGSVKPQERQMQLQALEASSTSCNRRIN